MRLNTRLRTQDASVLEVMRHKCNRQATNQYPSLCTCSHSSPCPTPLTSTHPPIVLYRPSLSSAYRILTCISAQHGQKVQRWRENWNEYAWPIFSKIGRLRAGPTTTRVAGARGSPRGGFFSSARGGGWSTRGQPESVAIPALLVFLLLASVPWLSHMLESWAADGAAAADRWRRQWT